MRYINETTGTRIREERLSAGQSPEEAQSVSSDTSLFRSRLLQALTVAGLVGSLTACTNEIEDVQPAQNPTVTESSNAKPKSSYPEIHVSVNDEQSISTFSLSLWDAEKDYTFTVTPHNSPEDVIVINTAIREDGWYGTQQQFKQPVSGFDVSAVLNDGAKETVLITNPCEGERDTCIKGFQSYPK